MQGFLVLLIPISAIFSYKTMAGRVEHSFQFICKYLHNQILSEIQTIASFLIPIKSSTTNLVRVLNVSLNATQSTSFSTINNTVSDEFYSITLNTIYVILHVV